MSKLTIRDIIKAKGEGRKLTMIAAYDYPTASLADKAGIDLLLVGIL